MEFCFSWQIPELATSQSSQSWCLGRSWRGPPLLHCLPGRLPALWPSLDSESTEPSGPGLHTRLALAVPGPGRVHRGPGAQRGSRSPSGSVVLGVCALARGPVEACAPHWADISQPAGASLGAGWWPPRCQQYCFAAPVSRESLHFRTSLPKQERDARY